VLTYDHTRRLFESLGIDATNVLEHGADESGYLVFGRHPDGEFIATSSDGPLISRVPWPTSTAFAMFRGAQLADGVLPPHPTAVLAASAVERAAEWLEARRDRTWNGGERRPTNFGRAASELRQYAAELRGGERG